MSKKLTKSLSFIFAVVLIFSAGLIFCCSARVETASAAEINHVAENTIKTRNFINERGSNVTHFSGIQFFANEIGRYNLSDEARAKYIYKYIGEDEYVVSTFSDEQLAEAFTFTESTRITDYIHYEQDGQTYLTKEELICQLVENYDRITDSGKEFLIANGVDINELENSLPEATVDPMSSTTTVTDDGYLSLTTVASKTTGALSDRTYYIISADANWLLVPTFLRQDVLAITSSSTATYDNTYNNYGYFYERCDEYVRSEDPDNLLESHIVDNKIYKNSGTSNPDDIKFEYTTGIAGLALRFNMYEGKFVGDTRHEFVYRRINAYLRYKVSLYNVDGGVQAGYGHKQFSLNNIKVSLAPLKIDFSIVGLMAKYYGETLSIYY